jgi:hypothetical protein
MKNKKSVVLKSGIDPFLIQAIELGVLGTITLISTIGAIFGIIFMFKKASIAYDIHINVIVQGTQILLDEVLGHEPGIRREVINTVLALLDQHNLGLEDQINVLEAIRNNIIEYRDTQAISELEGQKLQQVFKELETIIQNKTEKLKEIIKVLKEKKIIK